MARGVVHPVTRMHKTQCLSRKKSRGACRSFELEEWLYGGVRGWFPEQSIAVMGAVV